MGKRLDVDWTEETVTDEHAWNLFSPIAKQLSGLTLQGHADGRVLIFLDHKGRVLHVLYNISDNNWGCFCPDALDGECPATTYARARLMKTLGDWKNDS
jgi:hypothetical protein